MKTLVSWLAAVLVLAPPLYAENPRVRLQLKGVTAEEAVGKLSQQVGVPVRLYSTGGPAGAMQPALLERSDFDWGDSTLARALRDVCAKYQLRPTRSAGGYVLYPGAAGAAGPAERKVGLTEKDGIRLYARSVSVFENRQIHFGNGAGNASGGGSLQVYVTAELGDLDADSVAGIQNVVARDDAGNALGQQGAGYQGGYHDGAYPDEWSGVVSLPNPHPKARRITSLEGDLLVYRKVRPVRVEIPLPLTGKSVRKEQAGLAFWVSEFRPKPGEPDEEPEPLLNRAAVQPGGLSLRVRVYSPAGGGVQSRWGWGMVPYLVDAAGVSHTPQQLGGNSGSDGQVVVSESTLNFPNLKEPPAKVVWDLLERSDAVKKFSFRMTDIPLPPPAEFNAKAAAPAPQPENPENRPFYDRKGGTLVHRILMPGKAVGDGLLDVGLAAKTGSGWGPVRWIQVDVSAGVARLENVTPGAYRVTRRFRPRDDAFPKGGKWTGSDVIVTITAAKESILAPLQWVAPVKAKTR